MTFARKVNCRTQEVLFRGQASSGEARMLATAGILQI